MRRYLEKYLRGKRTIRWRIRKIKGKERKRKEKKEERKSKEMEKKTVYGKKKNGTSLRDLRLTDGRNSLEQESKLVYVWMTYFAKDYDIQLIRFNPFYAQANGQAEASNKVLINILEKMLENNPRDWHIILSKTLWAYRTSKRGVLLEKELRK